MKVMRREYLTDISKYSFASEYTFGRCEVSPREYRVRCFTFQLLTLDLSVLLNCKVLSAYVSLLQSLCVEVGVVRNTLTLRSSFPCISLHNCNYVVTNSSLHNASEKPETNLFATVSRGFMAGTAPIFLKILLKTI